ncbi:MAG: Ig-like domain-containing protein [Gemmatimonadales bacterium]
MRRIALLGLVIMVGCTPASAPKLVSGVVLTNSASAAGLFPGDTFHVTATPYDATGTPIPITTFPPTYSSSNTSVATVSSGGLVTAVAPGTTKLQAQADGIFSGAYLITVDGNVTSRIVVTPNAPLVTAGNQIQLTAVVYTTVGNPARGKSVTWSTSDATKATVDGSGNVSGVAATTGVSICATSVDAPSVQGCATVTVH